MARWIKAGADQGTDNRPEFSWLSPFQTCTELVLVQDGAFGFALSAAYVDLVALTEHLPEFILDAEALEFVMKTGDTPKASEVPLREASVDPHSFEIGRPGESARYVIASPDLGEPPPCVLRIGSGSRRCRLVIGSDSLCLGRQLSVVRRQRSIHALKARPKPFIGFGILFLQLALLIRRWHRNSPMYLIEQLALRLVTEPVRKLAKSLVQRHPEGNTVRDRWWRTNRAKARDVLMAHLAVNAAGLDQTALQPATALAEAHEHVVALHPRFVTHKQKRATTPPPRRVDRRCS